MNKLDKKNMPIHIIVLSLIFIFPLGIYYIVLKTSNNLSNMRMVAKWLKRIGLVGALIILIYLIFNSGHYISLVDSHMSLDMYNYSFVYFYLYSLMVTISSLVGASYLNKKCDKLMIYTEFINVYRTKDIGLISEETLEDIGMVKRTINKLIESEHLIDVELRDNCLVYKKNIGKSDNLVKCKSCGNVQKLIKDKVKCDFCLRELTVKDK